MPQHPTSAPSALTSPTLRLAAAGFIATAIAVGPARMGFGLYLPAFRDDFALVTRSAGRANAGSGQRARGRRRRLLQ